VAAQDPSVGMILDGWRQSGASIRSIARARGVSPSTAHRWLHGVSDIPEDHLAGVAELVRRNDPTDEVRRVTSRHPSGRTDRELSADLSLAGRRELSRQVRAGELPMVPVVRDDASGRRYVRRGIAAAGSERGGLARSAPVRVPGSALRKARRRRGISAEDFAGRVTLSAATIRTIEACRDVPRARVVDFAEALGDPLIGDEIRAVREAAGWSLEQLARRVEVKNLSQVQHWEKGRRDRPSVPVPRGRQILLEAALADADDQAANRPERRQALREDLERRVQGLGPAGISERAFLHGLRVRRNGRPQVPKDVCRELDTLARQGRVVRFLRVWEDSMGRPKSAVWLVAQQWAPDEVSSAPMTGHQLGAELNVVGLSQWVLAGELGVHPTQVSQWVRRGDRVIPSHRGEPIRGAIAKLVAEQRKTNLDVLGDDPGAPMTRVLDKIGRGAFPRRSLKAQIEDGELVKADAWDGEGRRYDGYYRASEVPKADAVERITGDELRRLRRDAGWSAAALAEALEVRANTVSRWESGIRQCPPERVRQVRKILAKPAPPRARDQRRLACLLELAGQPGGVMRGSLPPMLRGTAGQAAIAAAMVEGSIHEEERGLTVKGGRTYIRRFLVAGEAGPSPIERMRGDELRDRREAAGLSQSELARRLGITAGAVNRWERIRDVPPGRIEAIRAGLLSEA